MESDSKPAKKEYPNSGCLFRKAAEDKKSEKDCDYSGTGEINIDEALPAGSKISFFLNAYIKEFNNRKTGKAEKFFSIRFKMKGSGKATAASRAPTGFGAAAAAPAPATTAEQPAASQQPEPQHDEPKFEY